LALPDPTIPTRTLAAERLQLHYASRLLASGAQTFLPQADDDGQSNLGLDAQGTRFTTHPLDSAERRLELDLRELRLVWTLGGVDQTAHPLPGSTMAEAYAWLNASRPADTPEITERAFPDFPAHPLGTGAPFVAGDPERRAQLGRYFALGQVVMDRLAAEDAGMSPPRIWPHHFDMGVLIPLPTAGQSVGVGLSPGDGFYDEPYFYISAYPAPQVEALPVWASPGHWHTDGFVSLVVTATEWQAVPEAPDAATWRAVSNAVTMSRSILVQTD
jgi:hypothetical protein